MLQEFGPVTQFPEIAADKLLRLVEKWLRAEQARQRQQREEDARSGKNCRPTGRHHLKPSGTTAGHPGG